MCILTDITFPFTVVVFPFGDCFAVDICSTSGSLGYAMCLASSMMFFATSGGDVT